MQEILGLKVSIFWEVTPCNPLKFSWRFGGIFRLHFQGRSISQENISAAS
jgi:hypothetical protein